MDFGIVLSIKNMCDTLEGSIILKEFPERMLLKTPLAAQSFGTEELSLVFIFQRCFFTLRQTQ